MIRGTGMIQRHRGKKGYSGTGNSIVRRIQAIPGFDRVRFIILFGSQADGSATSTSDTDLCIWYDGTPEEASRFRFQVLSGFCDDRYDIHIFQQLSLAGRMGVLRGTVLYADDPRFVYHTAYTTIREYDMFRRRLYDYTGQAVMS